MIRLVIFSACRLTNMGAENVHHGLAQVFVFCVFRQVEELISAAHAHGVTTMP